MDEDAGAGALAGAGAGEGAHQSKVEMLEVSASRACFAPAVQGLRVGAWVPK